MSLQTLARLAAALEIRPWQVLAFADENAPKGPNTACCCFFLLSSAQRMDFSPSDFAYHKLCRSKATCARSGFNA